MKDFVFEVGTKVLFGKNQLEKLPKEIKKYGVRVMICYGGGSIKKTGLYDEVTKLLDEHNMFHCDFNGIEPNPRLESVNRGIEIARENNVDFLLAIGGGSVIDCTKLVAASIYTKEAPWNIVLGETKVDKAMSLGVILTLSATGSEMDSVSVISNLDTKQKLGWGTGKVLPKFAIMNPVYTFSVPAYHTAAGVADIMSHTMENYFSLKDGCYMQDKMAEAILKTCVKYGPIAYIDPQNYEARANLMWSGSWAINGLLNTGKSTDWSVHAMEHELSAFYDITHGIGLAILTPNWLKYILNDHTVEKIAEFGRNVFNIDSTEDLYQDAKAAIAGLRAFFVKLGIPSTLREVGIGEEYLEEMAKRAIENKGGSIKGFLPLTDKDVLEIYKLSL